MSSHKSGSGFGIGLLTLLLGLTLLIGPMFIPQFMPNFSTTSQLLLQGFGVVILLFGGILMVIAKLYVKTAADEAFVRSGVGGRRCVINGGSIVIPMIHDVVPVSLRTTRLDVDRVGPDALLTHGGLRADVKAEFYIKVQPKPEDVLAAAQSLGNSTLNPDAVKDLVQQKLVSALRTVAATQTLEDLNSKRDQFAADVKKIVQEDLAPNGLTLESVTISNLDQTNPAAMKPDDNVFDAMGARAIAEKTNAMRVERNLVKREADKKVKEQDVATDQFIYQQELTRTKAEAAAESAKQIAKAEAEARAKSAAAEQARLAGVAQAEADKGVEVAKVEQKKAIEVADQQRQMAAKLAEVERNKANELADRERQIAVAEAEKKRAEAQAQLLAAEQLRAKEEQAVETVNVTATAEREKVKAIITQQAEIEKKRLTEQMTADVAAYTQVKHAEGEKDSAERRADARIKLAEADKSAKLLEAEGDRAVKMVPVNVDREQVNVERARVDNNREDLKNKSEFDKIARDLQIELAKIEADKEANIARAKALGEALSKANMTMYGSNDTLAQMLSAFHKGQGIGQLVNGLTSSLAPEVKDVALNTIGNVGSGLGQLGAALIKKLTGQDVSPEDVEKALKDHAKGDNASA